MLSSEVFRSLLFSTVPVIATSFCSFLIPSSFFQFILVFFFLSCLNFSIRFSNSMSSFQYFVYSSFTSLNFALNFCGSSVTSSFIFIMKVSHLHCHFNLGFLLKPLSGLQKHSWTFIWSLSTQSTVKHIFNPLSGRFNYIEKTVPKCKI